MPHKYIEDELRKRPELVELEELQLARWKRNNGLARQYREGKRGKEVKEEEEVEENKKSIDNIQFNFENFPIITTTIGFSFSALFEIDYFVLIFL